MCQGLQCCQVSPVLVFFPFCICRFVYFLLSSFLRSSAAGLLSTGLGTCHGSLSVPGGSRHLDGHDGHQPHQGKLRLSMSKFSLTFGVAKVKSRAQCWLNIQHRSLFLASASRSSGLLWLPSPPAWCSPSQPSSSPGSPTSSADTSRRPVSGSLPWPPWPIRGWALCLPEQLPLLLMSLLRHPSSLFLSLATA